MAPHVLIVGATGVVGNAALERFVAAGWRATAISRRVPECQAGDFNHLALDLTDTEACRAAATQLATVTHVVYAALFEKPGLIAGWQEQDQMQTNLQMLDNLMQPLTNVATELEQVTLLQGTKAYGAHIHPISVPAREAGVRDEHQNFYWLQEDCIKRYAQHSGNTFSWTILRPQIVFGYSFGTAMNLIPVLGAYAGLCSAAGKDFAFPGGADTVQEAVDAELLGDVILWSATAEPAQNETFNVTNGDVYHWRSLWPAIADALKVKTGPDKPRSLAQWLPAQEDAWAQLVTQHQLRPLSLEQLLGESHYYADAIMGYGGEGWQQPALLSTIKLRQAGFTQCVDTEAMFYRLFAQSKQRGLFP